MWRRRCCARGLQDLAAALERTLAADPDDTDALWKLAEVHRRQGDFPAARSLYRRLRMSVGHLTRESAAMYRQHPREATCTPLWARFGSR